MCNFKIANFDDTKRSYGISWNHWCHRKLDTTNSIELCGITANVEFPYFDGTSSSMDINGIPRRFDVMSSSMEYNGIGPLWIVYSYCYLKSDDRRIFENICRCCFYWFCTKASIRDHFEITFPTNHNSGKRNLMVNGMVKWDSWNCLCQCHWKYHFMEFGNSMKLFMPSKLGNQE